jgi:photosystem II stability/assembly factor-like uncharacterized protein
VPGLRIARALLLAGVLAACLAPRPALAQGFQAAATKDGVDAWLAGDVGVVWRSLDGGATYASRALGTKTLRAVAARGFTVLVAGDSGQVWRSTDNGGTWTLRTVPGLVPVRALAMPSASRAYLAGDGGLLMRSDDGGDTWAPQASGTAQRLNALAALGEDDVWAAGAAGTLLRTSNGGAAWAPVVLGTTVDLYAVAASGLGVWVGGARGGCWRSTTGGAPFTFQDLGADLLPDISAIAMTSPSDVWIAGGGGFVRHSTDGGATWTWPIHALHGPIGGIAFTATRGVVALRSARIAARWAGGGSLSLPTGATLTLSWTRQLNNSLGANIRGNTLVVNPLARSTVWAFMGSALYRSRDDGENWVNTGSVLSLSRANALVISPADTNVMVMAGVSTGGQRNVYRSVNSGSSWTVRLNHAYGEYGIPIEQNPDRPDTLLFGGDDDVLYRSVDGGVNWSPYGSTVFRSPCDIATAPGDANRVVVADGTTGVGRAYLFQSLDGGAGFAVRDSVDGSEVPALSVSRQRNDVVFAMTWSAIGASVSTDGGEKWEKIADLNRPGQDVAATWGTDVARDDPNFVLAGAFAGGISYLSFDGGATFSPVALGGSNYGFLARDRGSVFALQSGGVYKLRATYAYTPAAGAQSLTVTSPNGGEVWDAASVHPVTWNAANVAVARIEWRPGPSDAWQLVADVDGHLGSYAWTIPSVPTTTAELRVRDAWDASPFDIANGPFTIAGVLSAEGSAPASFALAPVAPTPLPAGATARVAFDAPRAGRVQLELFDVQGHRVRTLADRAFEPGRHSLALETDGLRAGVYFVRMRAGLFAASRRVLVLR